MTATRILKDRIAKNPNDITATLVLADAIEEDGDEATAATIRSEIEAKEMAAIRRDAEAVELREAIIAKLPEAIVHTLYTAKAAKGYAARQAEQYLSDHPEILVYVYSDVAITKSGLSRNSRGSAMYHRKSSGGKWARSVQMHRVSL